MRKVRSILLATDFRTASQHAAQATLRLAEVFGSHVTLLHVMHPRESLPSLAQLYREKVTDELRKLSQTFSNKQILVDESAITVGQPADMIVRKAGEVDADLIVIGAGEVSGEHCHMAPVAAAVVQHAASPVLTVRPGDTPATFRKILCPVDMSETAARGLANAIMLAGAFSGHIIVLSVVPALTWLTVFSEAGHLQEAAAAHEREWREEFDQFLTMCGFGNVSWEKELRKGAAHSEIIASARSHQADLIIMGSTGRTGLDRILMGSVTRRVVQELPCSLLTVKRQNVVEVSSDDELHAINVLYHQAQELLAAGSYEAALERFSHVLVRDPLHIGALEGKAEAHERLGHTEDAKMCRHRVNQLRSER